MKEDILNKLNNEIEYLNKLKSLVEQDNKPDFILDFYEVSNCEDFETFLYVPVLRQWQKRGLCENPKCKGRGYILVGSDTDAHYKMCDCFYSIPEYCVKILPVIGIVEADESYYLISGEKETMKIRCKDVLEEFEERHIDMYNPDQMIYKYECECRKACTELTNRLENSDGK